MGNVNAFCPAATNEKRCEIDDIKEGSLSPNSKGYVKKGATIIGGDSYNDSTSDNSPAGKYPFPGQILKD